MKMYTAVSITAWLILIGISAGWNLVQASSNQHEIYLQNGRAFFNLIVTTREWNARHGGVYVPVSAHVQPNPYLDVPNRDVMTTDGQQLTLINPAYMTRLISELAAEKDQGQFHITSLKPIRPENAAEEWEEQALREFEAHGAKEHFEYATQSGRPIFRYIAPLITQASCLKCHEKQGYKVGDVRGGISVTLPVHFRYPWALIWSHLAVGLVGGGVIWFAGRKITESVTKLENLSNLDGLTQIHNRRFFDEIMTREFLYCRRNRVPLTVALCDIDSFKAFNDFYGHQAGDECLKKVAQALSDVLRRPGDLVTRYGGEEFGILLPHTSAEGGQMIAELLRARVEALQIPHQASSVSPVVTVSIGLTVYEGEGLHIQNLLTQADQALYRAKASGKNCVVAWQERDKTG